MNSTLFTLLTLLTLTTSALAVTPEEIDKAIHDLGASNHKTREAATKFLAEAGKAAVPALEKAAQSSDPEIRLRAAELLPAARLGVPTNFLADVREALANYPKATLEEKQATIQRVSELGRQGRPVLISLAASEKDFETRLEIFSHIIEPISRELLRRLAQPTLDADAISRVLEGLELYQAIVIEDAQMPTKVIQRLDQLGKRFQADDVFERTYRIIEQASVANPKNPEPHNNIAWLCAVSRRRLDDGLKHIDQALAAAPDEAALLDTKAELLFQKGEKDHALELIKKAITRSPDFDYFQKQRDRIKKGDPSVPPPEPETQ